MTLFAAPASAYEHGSRYYRSTDGAMVHNPTRGNRNYGPVTAQCADGSVLGPHEGLSAGFGIPGAPTLWLDATEGSAGNGVRVAFRTASRPAIAHFHTAGLQAGGRDKRGAGLRPDYGAPTTQRS